jgi:hypothetical protein
MLTKARLTLTHFLEKIPKKMKKRRKAMMFSVSFVSMKATKRAKIATSIVMSKIAFPAFPPLNINFTPQASIPDLQFPICNLQFAI